MTVDVISAFVFLVLLFLGWRSGALRQILRVVAIVVVIIGVPFVSPMIRSILFGESGRASPGIEVFSLLAAGVLIYITVAVAGWLAVKVLRAASPTLGFMDRVGGASIGAAKAAIIIYLGVVLMVMLEGPLLERDPDNNMGLREGGLTGFVSTYNVLAPWQFPDINRLHQALRVGAEVEKAGAHEVIREEQSAADFFRDERIKELLADEDLMGWVVDDHYPMTLADSRVRDVLNDKDLVEKLTDVEWAVLNERVRVH